MAFCFIYVFFFWQRLFIIPASITILYIAAWKNNKLIFIQSQSLLSAHQQLSCRLLPADEFPPQCGCQNTSGCSFRPYAPGYTDHARRSFWKMSLCNSTKPDLPAGSERHDLLRLTPFQHRADAGALTETKEREARGRA